MIVIVDERLWSRMQGMRESECEREDCSQGPDLAKRANLQKDLIDRAGKCNSAESQVGSLSLKELERSNAKRLGAQRVLIVFQCTPLDRALPSAVQLPQSALVILNEAYVVEVDVVLGVWCGRVARGCGFTVCGREGMRCLDQLRAFGWREVDRLGEEIVESRAFLWRSKSRSAAKFQAFPSPCRLPMKFRAGPFETACSSPISPQAFLIVCRNHTTGSALPWPL